LVNSEDSALSSVTRPLIQSVTLRSRLDDRIMCNERTTDTKHREDQRVGSVPIFSRPLPENKIICLGKVSFSKALVFLINSIQALILNRSLSQPVSTESNT